jgi:UDP-N-acetylmuramate--alanine ligase
MKPQKKLQDQKFHFVGVGGIGMCGLAELLHNMGAQVTGSDLSENANTEHLKKLGVKVFKGHQGASVGDADVVVYSSAVSESNPEIQAARAQQIPLIPRAEALSEIMRLKRGVAVAGTHGKTTTTSLAASIFLEAKNEPTIVIGGRLDLIQSTARLGTGEWMIAEADESDGSFSKLSPEIAIITNIDSDHLDYFKSFENLQKAFWGFAGKVPFYGVCIACGDDPIVRQTFKDFPKRILFYGFGENNDYRLKGAQGHFELIENGTTLGSFQIKVPGVHNALNATAAIVAGLKAGIDFETCCKGLLKFEGVDRRFHYKGEAGSVKVYDDYGHHPTEVRATLQGFREKFPKERLVVMFQPHRFSRTQSCWHEFTTCFQQADELILTDIYAAGEAAIAGISSQKLAGEIKGDQIHYVAKSAGLAQHIRSRLVPGDVFITLGAGDGWKVGMEVLELLKK